jgi:hypothetical protein
MVKVGSIAEFEGSFFGWVLSPLIRYSINNYIEIKKEEYLLGSGYLMQN